MLQIAENLSNIEICRIILLAWTPVKCLSLNQLNDPEIIRPD